MVKRDWETKDYNVHGVGREWPGRASSQTETGSSRRRKDWGNKQAARHAHQRRLRAPRLETFPRAIQSAKFSEDDLIQDIDFAVS